MLMVMPRHAKEIACSVGGGWRGILRPTFLGIACATGLLAGGQAMARDYATREVGEWTVTPSKDGTGCFLTRNYDRTGGTTLLLGLDVDGANHLSVLNAYWSIKPKDQLKISFRLSTGAYPRHFAVGMVSGDKQGFVTSFEARFPAYFAGSRSLDMTRGDVPVERLSLDGSGAAVAELRKCVDGQRAVPAGEAGASEGKDQIPKDPFATPAKRKSRR